MLIDAHAHTDRYDLLGEGVLESALGEIEQERIVTISNSMDPSSYDRSRAIAKVCRWVFPIFGVHPWNAPEHVGGLDGLAEALDGTPMIGEVGLDCYFIEDASAYPKQRAVLEFFLAAAERQGKIINLHTKGAEEETLRLLDRFEVPAVIVHWYSGPQAVFREMVDRGVYFTVGVEVLHSEHVRAIAREVPARQLLTETDNPGGPKQFIGGPGMPGLIKEVVEGVAHARGTTAEDVIDTVHANLLGLARQNPWLTDLRDLLEPRDAAD